MVKGILPEPGAVHDMIPRIRVFYPEWSGHDLRFYSDR